MAQGSSNESIAAALDITPDTIKAHLKAIFSKIGTDSRLALARFVHTVTLFSHMPPLWKLPMETWAHRRDRSTNQLDSTCKGRDKDRVLATFQYLTLGCKHSPYPR